MLGSVSILLNDPNNLGLLAVVQLATRDQHGERFRSNLLEEGKETRATRPDPTDKVIKVIEYTDYEHPGGIQMIGDILAVGIDTRKAGSTIFPSAVLFYDCRDPKDPKLMGYVFESEEPKIGVVGVAKLPDGRFLMVVTGGDGAFVEFYRSNKSSFFTSPTGAEDPAFEFILHDTWERKDHPGVIWPGEPGTIVPGLDIPIPALQSLNFINQKNPDKLFLVGASNTSFTAPLNNGADVMYLYEVVSFPVKWTGQK